MMRRQRNGGLDAREVEAAHELAGAVLGAAVALAGAMLAEAQRQQRAARAARDRAAALELERVRVHRREALIRSLAASGRAKRRAVERTVPHGHDPAALARRHYDLARWHADQATRHARTVGSAESRARQQERARLQRQQGRTSVRGAR